MFLSKQRSIPLAATYVTPILTPVAAAPTEITLEALAAPYVKLRAP